MSKESSEVDNNSSTEDIELMEFSRRSEYSDSGSSADFTAFGRESIKLAAADENKINDVAVSFLNTSDENHHEFDIERTSLGSLKGISSGDLTKTKRSSSDCQASVLTRKASSLEGSLIRKVEPLNETSARKLLSLNSLEGTSTGRVSSLDALEGPSIRRVSSLDTLKESSIRKVSSLDTLKESTIRKVSSLDTLKESSTRKVSSLDTLKESSTRKVSSLDTLKESSTRKISSLNSLERPSTRKVSFLDSLERSSTGRVSSVDPLERPSARRVSSLDPLERSSPRRVSSLDPLEGPSSRRAWSLDPLEGPSTRTVWFSDSAEESLPRIDQSHDSETETNESLSSDPPTEQSRSWLSRFSRKIRHSKYYLLFHVALLALPCSAGYMSSKYQTLCDGCPKLTFLVYIMGILGMWIIIIRIAAIVSRRYFAPRLTGHEFNCGLYSIFFTFLLCLIIEMPTIFSCKPVFYPPCEEFCIKVFYNYAYYLNVIMPVVFLLLILIHIPAYLDPVEDE